MSACPTCGQPGIPIMSGLPGAAGRAAAESGDLLLGGCFLPENRPHYECPEGHSWRSQNEATCEAAILTALRRHGHQQDPGMSVAEGEALAGLVRAAGKNGLCVTTPDGEVVVEVYTGTGNWTLYDEEDWQSWQARM